MASALAVAFEEFQKVVSDGLQFLARGAVALVAVVGLGHTVAGPGRVLREIGAGVEASP